MTNRSETIENAIVRIYGCKEGKISVVGTGFRVGRQTVLTCAHVVNSALGKDKEATERPTEKVQLDFPLASLASNGRTTQSKDEPYEAEVVGWYPMQDINQTDISDIAVLRLPSNDPPYLNKVRLSKEKATFQKQVRVCGFSKPDGKWAQGDIAGSLATHLMQLDNLNHPIAEGDSGAPIWDEVSGDIIGMVIAIDKPKSGRHQTTAQITSSETLLSVLRKLDLLNDSIIVPPKEKIAEQHLSELFGLLEEQHMPEVIRAFINAFEADAGRGFHTFYEDSPRDFATIKSILHRSNKPSLVASFAEDARIRIEQEGKVSSVVLEQIGVWRDRFLNEHSLKLADIQPTNDSDQPGYLLVSLELHTKVDRKNGVHVNVFAEVRRAGSTSIPLGGKTCALSSMGEYLHELIEKAEKAIASRITVELFLPNAYLEHDVANWKRVDEQGEAITLLQLQPYIIRSFERAKKAAHQDRIDTRWKKVLACVTKGSGCQSFHPQSEPFEREDLYLDLDEDDVTGLFLAADLTTDSTERQRIISDIVKMSVPFALWFSNAEGSTPAQRQAAFEELLQTDYMADFTRLSKKWRRYRRRNREKPERHLKLLCDCPDRWPTLSNSDDPEDALIAS